MLEAPERQASARPAAEIATPETPARSAGIDAPQIGDEPDSRIVRLPASYTPASTRTCAAALRASAPRL